MGEQRSPIIVCVFLTVYSTSEPSDEVVVVVVGAAVVVVVVVVGAAVAVMEFYG